jgi:pseudaminic acid synthase
VIKIANHEIGASAQPFIVAEISANHNQSLDRALEIVDAAAKAGAHAVKLQTYTADTMTLDLRGGDFEISNSGSPWKGRSLYELYQEAHTPWEWHEPIFRRCRELGMAGFSTPFDATAVDFLEKAGVPCYKIASFENIDLPLIRTVAATGKPMIMSTGMATIAEIGEAVQAAREAGCNQLVLLKCTSCYPAEPHASNLLTIPHLRQLFGCEVGLSDHTMGIGVAVAAVALGATIIEKHVTLRRSDGGVDSAFSLEPNELQVLVLEAKRARQALGGVHYGPTESERASLVFRRSLYVTENIRAGQKLTENNLRAIRPGYGLPPKYRDQLIGKTVVRDVERGTPASWDLIA